MLGGGNFGSDFEHLSVGECLMVVKTATGFLMDTFGVGLGERIKAEFDDALAKQAAAAGKDYHFTQEELDNLLQRQKEAAIRGMCKYFDELIAEDAKAAEAASLGEEAG